MYKVKRFSQIDPLKLLQMEFARKDYAGMTDDEKILEEARRNEMARELRKSRAEAMKKGGDVANKHISRQKGLLGKISDFFGGRRRSESEIIEEGTRLGREARNAEYERLLKAADLNSDHARAAVLNGRPKSTGGTPVSIEHIPNGTVDGKPIYQASSSSRVSNSGSKSASKESSKFSKGLGYVRDSFGKDAWKKGTLGQRGVQAAALGALAYGGYKGYRGLVDSEWDDDEDED